VLSARALRATFMRAAREGVVADQAHALLAWARAERPGVPNLGALADALDSPAQREVIAALQRQQYAADPTAEALSLERVFADGFAWRDGSAGSSDSGLPPLYPFQLH
jgi:hypothetical protein